MLNHGQCCPLCPGDIGQYLRTFFIAKTWERGISGSSWVEIGDAAKQTTMHGTAPPKKKKQKPPPQNVIAKVEELCHICWQLYSERWGHRA